MDKTITGRQDSKSVPPKNDSRNLATRSTSRQGSSKQTQHQNGKNQVFTNLILSPGPESKNVEESVAKIIELQQNLSAIIQHMDIQFDQLAGNQEKEFLNAFKYISSGLQKELSILKTKIDELSNKTCRDDKSKELERQLDFYKGESHKLYMATENNLKVIQELRRRQKELENERDFLQGQLKETMKEAKHIKKEYLTLLEEFSVLKVKNQQYEKEMTAYGDQNSFIQSNQVRQVKMDSSKTLQETDSTSGSHGSSPKRFSKHNLAISKIIEEYNEKHKNGEKLMEELISYMKKNDDIKNAAIDKLKHMLQKEKQEKIQLNQYISGTLAEISDYEILFVECVKAVRNEMLKRGMLNSGVSSNNNMEDGMSDIRNFLSLDKYKILELFVTTEKVMLGIYELMFPNNKFQINELLKPITEQAKSIEDDSNNNALNTSDLVEDPNERLQGDRSDFNQSYHFENLMLLMRNKQDFKKMISSPPVTGKHSRKQSKDMMGQFH